MTRNEMASDAKLTCTFRKFRIGLETQCSEAARGRRSSPVRTRYPTLAGRSRGHRLGVSIDHPKVASALVSRRSSRAGPKIAPELLLGARAVTLWTLRGVLTGIAALVSCGFAYLLDSSFLFGSSSHGYAGVRHPASSVIALTADLRLQPETDHIVLCI